MMGEYDLVIIGAGPAGMSAAITAARIGLKVAVIDEQPAVGGQVFRAVESVQADPVLRGIHTSEGSDLASRFHNCAGIEYFPRSTVWHIELDNSDGGASNSHLVLSVLKEGISRTCKARRIVLATGAQERPMPIPGWTLPGAMTAGASQILLKTAGAVPHGPTVIAGQGPLCWLIAVQLLRAGARVTHLVEITPKGRTWRAFRESNWWRALPILREGVELMREARYMGLSVTRHASELHILGKDRVEGLSWHGGEIFCDTVLLHDGVIPSTHISRALGLAHRWKEVQQYWEPVSDDWGQTSHAQVATAGDGRGIAGWQAAIARGALTALDAGFKLNILTADQRNGQASIHQKKLVRSIAIRPFLDTLYSPHANFAEKMPDEVIVCRCEEITARQIRDAVKFGATGPNQIKTFLRAGMGPCQGRMCGGTVAALVASERGVTIDKIAPLRPRAPYKPITVGALIGQPMQQR